MSVESKVSQTNDQTDPNIQPSLDNNTQQEVSVSNMTMSSSVLPEMQQRRGKFMRFLSLGIEVDISKPTEPFDDTTTVES